MNPNIPQLLAIAIVLLINPYPKKCSINIVANNTEIAANISSLVVIYYIKHLNNLYNAIPIYRYRII